MRIPIKDVTPEIGHAHIAGWVHEERDLGGLTFLLVRDRTGILQVTIPKKKVTPEVLAAVKDATRESVIECEGVVKATEKAPGGRELVPDTLRVVSRAETPLPLDVSEKVPAELDTRLDNRYLDLRKPRINAIFQIRNACLRAISEYLWDNGFTQVQTPKIVAAATEGGTELFPLAYFDKEAFLNQSPQLYKQMLMSAGFDRVFEIGAIFRAEEHNTVRHLNEATSIDIEMSFADEEDAMKMLENVVASAYAYVAEHCGETSKSRPFRSRVSPTKKPSRSPPPAANRSSSVTTSRPLPRGSSEKRWVRCTSSPNGRPPRDRSTPCRLQTAPRSAVHSI